MRKLTTLFLSLTQDTPVTITGLRFVELDGDDVNVTYTVSSGRLELITTAGVAEVSANNGSTVIYSGPLIEAPGGTFIALMARTKRQTLTSLSFP